MLFELKEVNFNLIIINEENVELVKLSIIEGIEFVKN